MKRLGQIMYRSSVNQNFKMSQLQLMMMMMMIIIMTTTMMMQKLRSYVSCTLRFNTYLSVKTFGPNFSVYLQAAKVNSYIKLNLLCRT